MKLPDYILVYRGQKYVEGIGRIMKVRRVVSDFNEWKNQQSNE